MNSYFRLLKRMKTFLPLLLSIGMRGIDSSAESSETFKMHIYNSYRCNYQRTDDRPRFRLTDTPIKLNSRPSNILQYYHTFWQARTVVQTLKCLHDLLVAVLDKNELKNLTNQRTGWTHLHPHLPATMYVWNKTHLCHYDSMFL